MTLASTYVTERDQWVKKFITFTTHSLYPKTIVGSGIISGSVGLVHYAGPARLSLGSGAEELIKTPIGAPAVGAIIDTPWDIIPDATSTYILRDGKSPRLIGKSVGGVLSLSGGVTRLTARMVGGTLSFAGGLGTLFSNTIAKIAMLFKKRGMTFTFSQRKATFTASKRSATFRKVP